MVRFSHIVVSILNVLALLWSIFIIFVYSSIVNDGPIECNTFDPIQNLLYGVFLFSLSLVALIGAIRANRRLLLVYVGVLFVWFVWLVLSSAFLLVVSKVSDAKAVKDHREYQLNEYPGWLRRYAVDGKRWVPIKRCMVRDQICKSLLFEKDASEDGNLRIGKPSILYSCCQPPLHCGFVNTNDTYWEVPKSGILSEDPDCQSWRNDLDQVCYDCNSCKAGYIRTLKNEWSEDATLKAANSGCMFIGFLIAFWAFRQAPMEDHHHHTANNVSAA
ncbi:hypothetical protein RHGRI_023155 [Rhododendron griersonianum]|uniref:Uncharacterized protein n=1 Tax=Rhododendron griersonianum TaxID=479676 RepID=A0AAV6J7Y8_9ERIC|nr:hypothetical protein RHGRI_023155 [Rhododendron griersonianum]